VLYVLFIIIIHFSVHYRFFQACICSAILDNHAKGLRDTVVDVLSDCSKGTSGRALFSPAVSNTLPSTVEMFRGVVELGMSLQKPCIRSFLRL
jgi:hypothetical protein